MAIQKYQNHRKKSDQNVHNFHSECVILHGDTIGFCPIVLDIPQFYPNFMQHEVHVVWIIHASSRYYSIWQKVWFEHQVQRAPSQGSLAPWAASKLLLLLADKANDPGAWGVIISHSPFIFHLPLLKCRNEENAPNYPRRIMCSHFRKCPSGASGLCCRVG